MKPQHIISAEQFDRRFLDGLFEDADMMAAALRDGNPPVSACGRIMATLFYEPSTRTRLSFEAAMQRLGGGGLTPANAAQCSSAAKGESLEDTIRIVDGYCDVIVLRHHERGAAERAASVSSVPIINAGDGDGEHPTQALLDLYTMRKEKGRIDGLKIALVGDLLYGRTVHSLARLLLLYDDMKIFFVSPPNLRIPENYIDCLVRKGVPYNETHDFRAVEDADIIYMTRVQKERFSSEDEYARAKKCYVLDRKALGCLKRDAVIMHPLPRVGEVSPEIDNDQRAAYFRQARNGLYVRMALLKHVLS